jgi:hypothetical protein
VLVLVFLIDARVVSMEPGDAKMGMNDCSIITCSVFVNDAAARLTRCEDEMRAVDSLLHNISSKNFNPWDAA